MSQYKLLGNIFGIPVQQDKDGHTYLGSSKDNPQPFLAPDNGETIEEFCKQYKQLTADPKDRLIEEVRAYLNDLDNAHSANSSKMREILEAIDKETK